MRKSAFPLCGKALFKQWVRLSLSLIVGDALRLGAWELLDVNASTIREMM